MLLLGNSVVVNEPLGLGLRIQRLHDCGGFGSKGFGRFGGAGIQDNGTQLDQRQKDASTDDRMGWNILGGELFIVVVLSVVESWRNS